MHAELLEQRAMLSGQIFLLGNPNSGPIGEYTTTGKQTLTFNSGIGFSGIAVSGNSLFLEFGSVIYEMPTSGPVTDLHAVISNGGATFGTIAIAQSDLFVVQESMIGFGDTIGEYATSGTALNSSLLSAPIQDVGGMTISGQDIFVTYYNGSVTTVGEYTTSGATVNASLITGFPATGSIAVSGSSVYLGNGNGLISEYSTSGALINASLIPGLSGPISFAVDQPNLFVLSGDGTVGEYTMSGEAVAANLISGVTDSDSVGIAVEGGSTDTTEGTIVFTTQPSDTIAADSSTLNYSTGTISPAVVVSIEDQNGQVITTDNSGVTLSIASGPNGAVLGGTTAVQAQSGIATFSDISLNLPGVYTLEATDSVTSDAPATSQSFTGTTLLTLANLSNDVYSAAPSGTSGYSLAIPDADPSDVGYKANAYLSTSGTQAIIAIRGTYPHFTQAAFENLLADISFGKSTPTSQLISEVDDAVSFVQAVKATYPNAAITLTGHSLGGAVAQLIGEASDLPTYAFNAPGAEQLFSSLSTQLAPVVGFGDSGTNTNYRIYGDQISQFGTPFGQTITLAAPPYTSVPSQPPAGYEAWDLLVNNWSTYINVLHGCSTVVAQVAANAQQVSPVGQPDDATALESNPGIIENIATTVISGKAEAIAFATESLIDYVIDPSEGSDFVLSASSGSPPFDSIELPALSGVSTYRLRTETGRSWSAFKEIEPAVARTISAGVDAVEFQPVSSDGSTMSVATGFTFGASFSSAGDFSGTLEATDTTSVIASGSSNLAPTIGSVTLPTSVVAGARSPAKINVAITNTAETYVGPATVNVYADTGTTLDGNQVLVASTTKQEVIKAGTSTTFLFNIKSLTSTLPAGTYHLLVEVVDSSGAINLASTTQTVLVAAAFVDLSTAVSNASASQIKPGKAAIASVTVVNNGNVPATGRLTIDIALTPDGSTLVDGTTFVETIRLLPGAHKVFRLIDKIPVGFAPGSYDWVVTVDPGNSFDESNTSNNSATASTPVIVPNTYPVLGTFNGPVSDTRGPDKGLAATQAWTVTSEDQSTGAIAFTYINYYTDGTTGSGSGIGTITAEGVIKGAYSTGTTFVGRLVGKVFKGTHLGLNGDYGPFDLVEG